MNQAGPQERRRSVAVDVGGVMVGGGAPMVVQSMTNTDTADVAGTTAQVAALARAGSELVRITVDRDEAAAAVPHIKERLLKQGINVPIVGDFHYIGHKLLADHPACAEALDKYRINPGNVGFKDKKDRQFSAIVETAIKHNKPVRIGANWGSLDQELLTHLMDENSRSNDPKDAREVTREAMVQSALLSAQRAEEIGLGARPHHPVGESLRGAGPDRGLSSTSRRAPTMRCISASPRPAWDRRASSRRRPRSACCCSRGSATPSASRSRPSPAATARSK